MNYLGHALMAHEGSDAYVFGAMADDLASMYAGARALRRDELGSLPVAEQEFYRGTVFHHRTDIVFDRILKASGVTASFYEDVAPDLKKIGCRPFAVNKVGTDLLFDGEVLRLWPEATGHYVRAIDAALQLPLAWLVNKNGEEFAAKVARAPRRPADYTNPAVIARILQYRLQRRQATRIAPEQLPSLGAVLEHYQAIIQQTGRAVIEQTARELGVMLPTTQIIKP